MISRMLVLLYTNSLELNFKKIYLCQPGQALVKKGPTGTAFPGRSR